MVMTVVACDPFTVGGKWKRNSNPFHIKSSAKSVSTQIKITNTLLRQALLLNEMLEV